MKKQPDLVGATLHRSVTLDFKRADGSGQSIPVSISSEAPVVRGWGVEILDHSPSAIDFSRLVRGALPLLVNHDATEVPRPGNIERVHIANRKLRGIVRLSDTERGRSLWTAIEDEVLAEASVGYQINEVKEEGRDPATGLPVFRVTKWTPLEASLVNLPADVTVGVGRARENKTMSIEVTRDPAAEAERTRIEEITALGEAWKPRGGVELAQRAVLENRSLDEFKKQLLARLPETPMLHPAAGPDIGATDLDVQRYSIIRLVRALANPQDRQAQKDAGYEFEVSEYALKREGRGLRENAVAHIPTQFLLTRPDPRPNRRDLTFGTASQGGYTVGTQTLGDDFIGVLRAKSIALTLGATVLNGLVGNVSIPKQDTATAVAWVAEGGAATEGAPAYGALALSPKCATGWVDCTRRLLIQSSVDVQNLVTGDIIAGIGSAIDLAVFAGSQVSNAPTGVVLTAGIGSVAMGTNGLAPTWQSVLDLETAVATYNADVGSLAYATNPKVRAKLKATALHATNPVGFIWSNASGERPVNGYPCAVSSNVPSTLTKGTSTGVCSAMLFGNWNDLVVGLWSGPDVLVDPYTQSTAGTVRIVVHNDVDMGCRNAKSFAACLDMLTT